MKDVATEREIKTKACKMLTERRYKEKEQLPIVSVRITNELKGEITKLPRQEQDFKMLIIVNNVYLCFYN